MVLNKEVEEIHKENIAKLESMSHEEILEEQARIKASLGKSRNYAQRKTCLIQLHWSTEVSREKDAA